MNHSTNSTRRCRCCQLFVVTVAVASMSARAEESTARFYEELRQRSLFSLVEADCLRRLQATSLDDRGRSDLILELSKSFAAHAWETVGAEQNELWQRARDVVADWLRKSAEPPRRELLDAQLAFIDLSESEWRLAQFELQPEDEGLARRGFEIAGAAIERLTRLEKTLGQQVRTGAVDSAGKWTDPKRAGAALSPFERRALWQQVRWRLGTAWLAQAKFSEATSADRAAALVSASEWLLPLAGGASDDRLTGDARLGLAETSRLRSDFDQAGKVLSLFEKSLTAETPWPQRERFVIERTRLLLAKDQPADAAAFLLEQRRSAPQSGGSVAAAKPVSWSSELAYWQIATELAMWQFAADRKQSQLAEEIWSRVADEVAQLELTDRGYWAARAAADWRTAREVHDYGRELATLVRQARHAFAAGDADAAIRLFDEALAKAKRLESDREATAKLLFDLRDSRATLLFQAKRYADAAIAFEELAESPRQPRSPAVHLLWAHSLGRLWEGAPNETRQAEFAAALGSLSERYADQPEASEAAWLLGQLAERAQRFSDAIAQFHSIAESHPRRAAALAAIARCYERLIAQSRAGQESVAETMLSARRQLSPAAERILKRIANAPKPVTEPDDSNDLTDTTAELRGMMTEAVVNSFEAELLVRWARLLMENSRDANRAEIEELLASVINSARDRTWLNGAKQLQIVLLAGRRQIDEAERLLESLDRAGPDELLSLLDGLSGVAAQMDGGTQRLVAELQLRASRELGASSQSLTEPQRQRLWRAQAEAFAVTGQPSQAVAAYQKLLDKSPRDTRLLRAAADLCERIGSPESYLQAKGFWRTLESIHKPGSPDWLDARWHVIDCCQKRNEHAEATKLLKLTKLLYPDLGNAQIKARFAELERP